VRRGKQQFIVGQHVRIRVAGSSGNATLASTSEIPVGGGKVFSAEKVVVTQPTAGELA
jgi:hypothetical protein